tara:strand:- start:838 stop:1203 length:366 start_codon:yes stop_codon:yes gene_type:complete
MTVTSIIEMQSELGEFVYLKDSNIQDAGVGLFAKENIPKDTFIHYTHAYHIKYKDWINLTPNNKYNHSKTEENCEVVRDNKVMKMVTLRDIYEGEELLVDYTKNKTLFSRQLDDIGKEWIK